MPRYIREWVSRNKKTKQEKKGIILNCHEVEILLWIHGIYMYSLILDLNLRY